MLYQYQRCVSYIICLYTYHISLIISPGEFGKSIISSDPGEESPSRQHCEAAMQAMAQPRGQAGLDVGMESVSFNKKGGHVLKIYVEMCMYAFYAKIR